MLPLRETALLALLLGLPIVGCDTDKKSDEKKRGTQDGCAQQQSVQQSQFNQGQNQQTGGFGTGQQTQQTGGFNQAPTGFNLVAGDLFNKIKTDCANCHNGTTRASNYNDATVVTAAGATIVQRALLMPGAPGFMPQGGQVQVPYLAELQSWQSAGFPDISTYDPATAINNPTGNNTPGTGFPNNGGFGTQPTNTNCINNTNNGGTGQFGTQTGQNQFGTQPAGGFQNTNGSTNQGQTSGGSTF